MVADARPQTVAYFVETTFATPPADWDVSGQEFYCIAPDPSAAEHALVENENYNSTHLGMHGKIRGLKNCNPSLGSLYMHGSPNVTAEARDGTGNVAAATRKDYRSAVSVDYILYDSVTCPPHDAIVYVGGFDNTLWDGFYRVDSVSEQHTNNGYPAHTLGLVRYLNNGIPTNTTTTTT